MLKLNSVKERLMFLSPVVQAGWERESNIKDFEKIGDLGKVTHMKHKKSMIAYAIKQMNKAKLKASGMTSHIKTEIKIMYSLNHDNIIKLYNHFEDDDCIYLVLEYAPGGQLWQKLHKCEGKKMPEKTVAVYIKDLVHALEYLHAKGIIHRDIKPENLLLDSNGRLKLADFGWSNYLKPDAIRNTFCGTLDYLAPEMLQGGHEHDHMVDIWTVGVLIYELLTGKSPFAPKDALKLKDIERATQQNIVAGKYEFPKEFPTLAKDLVNKILKKNPKSRLGLPDIKSHPWIKVNCQDAKKKEINPEVLIHQAVFAQNMADSKNFVKAEETGEGVDPAFSEDEIIQFTRPDSMLDKNQEAAIEHNNNIQEQVNNFKIQLEKIICTTPGNNAGKPTTPKGDQKPLTPKGEQKPLTPKGEKRDATPENTKRDATPDGGKRNLTPDNKTKPKFVLKEEEKLELRNNTTPRDHTPEKPGENNKTPTKLQKINFTELGANIMQKSTTTLDLTSPKDAIGANINQSKLESQLKLKTEEAAFFKQEYENLKLEKNSWTTSTLMINALEQENVSLRLQVQEYEKKIKEGSIQYTIMEKEKGTLEEKLKKIGKERSKSPSGASLNISADDAYKNLELQLKEAVETRNRDKIYYESKITELETKLNYLQKGNFNTENGTKSKLDELEDMNKNLSQQISHYSKLLKSLQRDDDTSNDDEKQKMLDEVRTLQALSAVKQERIEKLERKLRSLSGQYKVV